MKRLLALALFFCPASMALAAPVHTTLERLDGSVIHYALDMPVAAATGLIVAAQGAGCLPNGQNPDLKAIRNAFPAYVVLTIEKRGLPEDARITNGLTDCPASFYAEHTFSQHIEDYTQVLSSLDPALLKNTILVGSSEGGLIAAVMAPYLRPKALIVLSSSTSMSFAEAMLSAIAPNNRPGIQAGLANARANPDSTNTFGGNSLRFLADVMDVRSLAPLLHYDGPILLIQGGQDKSAPVASARATLDAFIASGRCTLTYWEFPGFDHNMVDIWSETAHMPAVLALAAQWAASPISECGQH